MVLVKLSTGVFGTPEPEQCAPTAAFPGSVPHAGSTLSPRGGISTRELSLHPRLRARLSFDFHAATNIRYNSVKRNLHKALLPYGNKLKRLGRYISQNLKGYIHMAKLIEGTPALGCRPKWPLLEKAHQPRAAAPNGNCLKGYTSLGLPPYWPTLEWVHQPWAATLMANTGMGTPALGCHPNGQHWKGYTSLGLPP